MMRFVIFGLWVLILSAACQPRDPSSQGQVAPAEETPTTGAVAEPQGHGPGLGSHLIEVRAHMQPLMGTDLQGILASPDYGHHFSRFSVAEPRRTYKASDFSVFLPQQPVQVGDTWSVPGDGAAAFLKQIHPSATANLNMPGSGAFATLRARSGQHWDILFRVHAQFVLAPRVFLTPGQFAGRLILNPTEGTVDYVAFSVPTERHTNVDVEVLTGDRTVALAFVPRMELVGGDLASSEAIGWDEEMDHEEGRRLLSSRFYAFQAIDWVPLERALERAQKRNAPIFAIVIKGVLDDQSC